MGALQGRLGQKYRCSLTRPRGEFMDRFVRSILVTVALLAACLPAAAQQFPSQQRGLTADTAYQSGELESVNLFNGNLSLSIPLGQPYPVGPSFSLSFTLRYNSK